MICQCNNDNCSDDFANINYEPLYFHEESLACFFQQDNVMSVMFQLRKLC